MGCSGVGAGAGSEPQCPHPRDREETPLALCGPSLSIGERKAKPSGRGQDVCEFCSSDYRQVSSSMHGSGETTINASQME